MINLFFIIKDWCLNGVKTFEKNLVLSLSKNKDFKVHILFMPEFGYENSIKGIDVPKELLKFVITFDVSLVNSWTKRVEILKEYILSYKNNIVICNYYYNFFQLSYDKRINFISILHSDQEIYYAHTNKYRNFLSSIVSVSQVIQKKLKDIYKIDSEFIPYGIDIEKFDKRVVYEDKKEINIVYCGRLEQIQKRVLDLIKLVKNLESSKIKYKLHIIGDGNYLNILKSKIKNKKVVFYGRLNEDEIVEVFKQMDIIVLVSEYEGLPLVLLEAMNMGIVPVVTNFKSGLNEVLSRFNSKISPIGDMRNMKYNIKFYYDNPNILFEHKKRARRIAKRFSIEKMALKYKLLFERVISKPKNIKIEKADEYIDEYRDSEKISKMDDFIEREGLILKNVPNIAIYGYGNSGKMIFKLMKHLNREPKFIIDDSLSHSLSIKYEEFKTKAHDVDVIVMGKYQNIYHDIDSLNKTVLRLESIR